MYNAMGDCVIKKKGYLFFVLLRWYDFLYD